MGNRERDAQASPVGDTEQGSPPRAGRIHHGTDVVHPLAQARRPRDRIRQPRAPLVEEDHPGEGRKPPQKPGQVRLFPGELDVRDEAGHKYKVERAITESLIGDVHLSAPGVARGRHHISLQAATSGGPPTLPGDLSGRASTRADRHHCRPLPLLTATRSRNHRPGVPRGERRTGPGWSCIQAPVTKTEPIGSAVG